MERRGVGEGEKGREGGLEQRARLVPWVIRFRAGTESWRAAGIEICEDRSVRKEGKGCVVPDSEDAPGTRGCNDKHLPFQYIIRGV